VEVADYEDETGCHCCGWRVMVRERGEGEVWASKVELRELLVVQLRGGEELAQK